MEDPRSHLFLATNQDGSLDPSLKVPSSRPTITQEHWTALLRDSGRPMHIGQRRQQGLLMLVLVAGSDLEYCARVGETLQRASHEVVLAASLEVCRSFAAKGTADAVILATTEDEEIPVDLLEQVRGPKGTPLMLLLDDVSPAKTSIYTRAGAECAPKPEDPEDIARWLQLAAS